MTFLPIVSRELRVAARRSSTYWLRVALGLMALLVSIFLFLALSATLSPALLSMNLFRALGILAFVYCLLAGTRVTADCLSEEKREGTLGLLFLTDLKGYDVVLGKLAATSLRAVYGLVALLPVLAIPILLGGVTLADFGRVALVLVNTLFFSLAAGILVSTLSRVERKATGGTLLLILIFVFVPYLVMYCMDQVRPWTRVPVELFVMDPVFPFTLALWPNNAAWSGTQAFYWATLLVHGWGWLFLALASWKVPTVWKEKPSVPRAAQRGGEPVWSHSAGAEQKAFRARLLAINPIFWLSSRHRAQQLYPWAFLAALLLIWLQGYARMGKNWLETDVAVFFMIASHSIFKLWVSIQASYSFALDREKGAWELLLSTPLPAAEMVRGQWLALQRLFLWPVVIVVLSDMLLWHGAMSRQMFIDGRAFWTVFFWGNIAMFLADLTALGWVGIWMGVNSKSATRAAAATIGRILLLPWAPLVLIWVVMIFVALTGGGASPNWSKVLLAHWLCLGMACDGMLGFRAWRGLRRDLRNAALPRFESQRPGAPALARGHPVQLQ